MEKCFNESCEYNGMRLSGAGNFCGMYDGPCTDQIKDAPATKKVEPEKILNKPFN